jgi:prevent-host-death family protein
MNVGIYEAKSNLSRLVERAEAGEEIVLTRRGRAVAKIVRLTPPSARDRAALLRDIRALSRKVKIPKRISIQELVSEGRD